MKLYTLLLAVILFCGGLTYLALDFAPEPAFYTKDWREAAKYQRDCKGHAHIEELVAEWKITCEEKDVP